MTFIYLTLIGLRITLFTLFAGTVQKCQTRAFSLFIGLHHTKRHWRMKKKKNRIRDTELVKLTRY